VASWSRELLSATDRIHYLITERHQPTQGGYREALLRRLLRRVLPDRFRVSTGFIYRWDEQPSRQLDIVIWDAQNHSALLEEGEFIIRGRSRQSCRVLMLRQTANRYTFDHKGPC
jgi:hypothetical protein